jgi:hypothetical protein
MTHLPDVTSDGRFNDKVSFIQTYNESLNSWGINESVDTRLFAT